MNLAKMCVRTGQNLGKVFQLISTNFKILNVLNFYQMSPKYAWVI
jgi:hypothetical protein